MTVEQYSIESIFHEMGYKSSTDYAIKKMQEELLRELKVHNTRIELFEEKYGMTYVEFERQFNQVTQFNQFERENDIMDWRVEMIELRGIEKRLAQLVK
ncbi:hypothetical protein DYU11_10610 [Fibrisoma montanum]|uniref:Uncharacterized protein n=1 Tax=Fibrisoma montanum TaxID=2305895 RepID=A0A418MAP1_9BACT|nr:hypothetical protein [Fibrisoma montanum]RIV23445.1 hypothetical protein DYU11_10610 [Fibrisoma montanum]